MIPNQIKAMKDITNSQLSQTCRQLNAAQINTWYGSPE